MCWTQLWDTAHCWRRSVEVQDGCSREDEEGMASPFVSPWHVAVINAPFGQPEEPMGSQRTGGPGGDHLTAAQSQFKMRLLNELVHLTNSSNNNRSCAWTPRRVSSVSPNERQTLGPAAGFVLLLVLLVIRTLAGALLVSQLRPDIEEEAVTAHQPGAGTFPPVRLRRGNSTPDTF